MFIMIVIIPGTDSFKDRRYGQFSNINRLKPVKTREKNT